MMIRSLWRHLAVVGLFIFTSAAIGRPLVVFSGGFGSCAVAGSTSEIKSGAEMTRLVDGLREASGESPLEIRTCYAIGSESTIYVTASELDITDQAMTREDFYDVVRSASNIAGAEAPVYVWGQSHGGWTSLSLVANVDGLNYRMLTTVDPISIAECGPVVFSGGLITGTSDGCRRAPRDLETVYPMISQRVGRWVNWYQLEFSLLHSSEIQQADENIERRFDADWWVPMGAHSMTERDPIMWERTLDLATQDVRQM